MLLFAVIFILYYCINIIINCKWVYTLWQCATIQYSTIQYNTITHITHNNVQHSMHKITHKNQEHILYHIKTQKRVEPKYMNQY